MSLLGNIIWLIFGGFLTGLGYILGGLVLCLTIIFRSNTSSDTL